MNKEQIIEGLKFTKEMFLLDPITNETMTKEQLNDMGRTTVDACEGAIEILLDIPQDHDGCKDCRYQDKGEDELPCCECKQNYMDKWKAISNKVGQWIDKGSLSCRCDQCGCKNNRETKFCPHCGARMVEPTCDTCEYTTAAFNPCNACKDKSEYKPQESEINNG